MARIILYEPKHTFWMVVIHVLVLIGLGFLMVYAYGEEPRYEQIRGFGCEITQNADFNRRWQVEVWADYQAAKEPSKAHDWKTLLAVYDSRKRAMRECDRWMRAVQMRARGKRP